MKNDKVAILLVISFCVLLTSLGTSIANIALPVFEEAFSTTFQLVQWVTISYLLAITVSVTIVGKLADQYGHRRILLTGLLLFTIASFLCAFAPTISALILMRALQGMGAAVLMTMSVTIVKKNNKTVKMGSAMGLIGTLSAVGTAMGPSVGGFLLSVWGWPSIFLLLSCLGIPTFWLSIYYVRKDNLMVNNTQRINVLGVVTLVVSIAAYALSMTLGKEAIRPQSLLLILVSVLSGRLFVYVQKRSSNPLIDASVFKNWVLRNSLLANFLVATIMMTTLVVGPFFLTVGLGLNEFNAGLVMSVGPLISILTGIPAGKLVDTLGPDRIVKIGLHGLWAGTIALASLPAVYGLTGYIIGICLLTPGYQLFQAGNNTAVMAHTSKRQDGIIAGILNLSRNLGLVTGASVMGALFSLAVATKPIRAAKPEDMLYGLTVTFRVGAILLGLVSVQSWLKSDKPVIR
ncbi:MULTISPECIES: MFS transporter [unclassified Spirosoma]|uniref:MFS transporter n=1 Tax=unclassified Spirosoma TaxID=2621999 RepID=UPI0009687B76|nr:MULTISPECIES: MFS transporter [unclassified Spirosoma]MBN8825699.1 MFS transporter [Spirosoma sp.]OJW76607.1 MAG: hypothetical protein BGO59_05990 [Spirosoma sp. 48-14]